MNLSLRRRILLGVGVVALVQLVAAVVILAIARDELIDQVDDRLEAALETADDVGFDINPLDGLGDVYQGVLASDGTLTTINTVTDRDRVLPPPELPLGDIEVPGDGTTARSAIGPITVDADRSDDEYRVALVALGDGEALVLAVPLDGYEWTLNRLGAMVAVSSLVVLAMLAAMAWWVIRLGVTPIKRMTTAAESVAASATAGDRSLGGDALGTWPSAGGSEAAQLGRALDGMMTSISTAFDARQRTEDRLRQFVADASHELRTPVSTIRGYAELYEAGALAEPGELDDAMRRTRAESERMSRLIADLLELARLDREKLLDAEQLERDEQLDGAALIEWEGAEPVDVAAIARDTVGAARAAHPGRTIALDGGDRPTYVVGDDDRLRQALSNLVDNAVVHTDPDVAIAVTVDGTGPVRIAVTDEGEGMPSEVARRATERFFRADPARSRQSGGSGLGLAIVDGIVTSHGGVFQLDSEVGRGTTATITLPAAT